MRILLLLTAALLPGLTLAQPNDNCGGAIPISLGTTPFDNTGSSFLGTDLAGGCALAGDNTFDNDLYYCFTAPSSGTVEVQFLKLTETGGGIPFEPRVAVLNGCVCPASGTHVLACGEGVPLTTLQFQAVAGNSYLLVVGGFFAFGTGTGEITITAGLPPVNNLACSDTPQGATLNWSLPAFAPGMDYNSGINVYVNGAVFASIPGTSTSYTYVAPGMTTGPVDLCVEGVNSSAGAAPQACCTVIIGGPTNDDCVDAISVTLGDTNFDSFLGTLDGPLLNGCGANANPDVWFRFTAPSTSSFDVSTCNGTSFDSAIAVYTDNGTCPPLAADQLACNVDACGEQSLVNVALLSGTDYLIRVGGENGQAGTGVLTIQSPCAPIGGLTCSYDCTTETASMTWTNGEVYSSIDVVRDGVTIATLPGTTQNFQDPAAPNGLLSYEFVAACGASTISSHCEVEVLSPTGFYTDLILSLETNLNPAPGLTESVSLLEPALNAAGRNTAVLRTQFLDYPCFDTVATQAAVIWVLTGTFPFDYRLTSLEGDALAGYAAQSFGIYLEGSDHWAFNHTASLLDDRDGIDPGSSTDGDGSFDLMNGSDGVMGPALAPFAGVGYTPDSLSGNDSTDQLSPMLTASLVDVSAVWTNADNSVGMTEGAYVTGVAATHMDGGLMLSKSWEFGGYGGDHAMLADAYIQYFGFIDPGTPFTRGDCNMDASINIADAVALLTFLFPSGCTPGVDCPEEGCTDACDTNDDGNFNIADAVSLLSVLFPMNCTPGVNCPGLPEPSFCGSDPTDNDGLDCLQYQGCP